MDEIIILAREFFVSGIRLVCVLENNVIAIFNLGVCYMEGFGTSKDLSKAIELFRRAADLDHSLSYTYLAKCHELMGSSEQIIIDCYENAYAQGSYKACYYLSLIYLIKYHRLHIL